MSPAQTIYELTFCEDPYEASSYYGTYASQELAEQVRDVILANQDPDDCRKLELNHCRIRPVEVQTAMPKVYLWLATIHLDKPEEPPELVRTEPRLHSSEPLWFHFEDRARFVQVPMQWVSGSGSTPEEAVEAMWAQHAKALSLGALEFLATSRRLAEEAQAESERRAAATEPDESGYQPAAWTLYSQVLQELALAEWGPGPHSNR